jgi:hypothetical protein
MLGNLTNFSSKKNWKQALIFYLAYFLLGLFITLLASLPEAMLGLVSGANLEILRKLHVGLIVSVIFCWIISGILLKNKKLFYNFGYIILALLSGVLAYFGGLLLGLIIPAIITTKQSRY